MPPPLPPRSILLAVLLASCSPSAFGWQDGYAQQIAQYRQSFADAAGSELVVEVSRPALLDRIRASKTLWLGDHHRHSRLHALHTELLMQLQQDGQAMALGLEAIGVRDERLVNQFLQGKINMSTLRERMRTRWAGSWLDDRELDPWFFRSLLQFAKRYEIPVFALEPTPRLPLIARDDYIARSVATARERHRDRLIVVILGQSHLRGIGDVVGRSEGPANDVILGGRPTSRLLQQARPTARGSCWQADSGVLWFGEMFRD